MFKKFEILHVLNVSPIYLFIYLLLASLSIGSLITPLSFSQSQQARVQQPVVTFDITHSILGNLVLRMPEINCESRYQRKVAPAENAPDYTLGKAVTHALATQALYYSAPQKIIDSSKNVCGEIEIYRSHYRAHKTLVFVIRNSNRKIVAKIIPRFWNLTAFNQINLNGLIFEVHLNAPNRNIGLASKIPSTRPDYIGFHEQDLAWFNYTISIRPFDKLRTIAGEIVYTKPIKRPGTDITEFEHMAYLYSSSNFRKISVELIQFFPHVIKETKEFLKEQ